MFKVMSHPRTGTHLLMKLLHLNFQTNVKGYRGFAGTHFAPWNFHQRHLGVVRPVLPTLRSLWQMRERFGIWSDVNFPMFLTTPWPDLPRSQACKYIFDGETRQDCNHQMAMFYWDTPINTWLWVQKHVWRQCSYTTHYDNLVADPQKELENIAFHAQVEALPVFRPVPAKVGFWSPQDEEVEYGEAEAKLLAEAQTEFDEFIWDVSRDAPFEHEHYEWMGNWRRGRKEQLLGTRRKRKKERAAAKAAAAKAPPANGRPRKRRVRSQATSEAEPVVRQVTSGPARSPNASHARSAAGKRVIVKGKTIIKRVTPPPEPPEQ